MSKNTPIDKLIELVKPELEQVNDIILNEAKSEIDLIPKLANHLIEAGGKRMRPVLTLASAKLCGYEGKRAINLAASVEFMHTATLLHDDVVDESELRRGRQTANNIWGNKASVLVGDFLLGRAFQMMTSDGSIPILEILSNAAARIAEGEVLQMVTANNIETTYEQYQEVIAAKTAELFAAACEVGGEIIQDKNKRKSLREFGMNYGIAFQIVDDALDYAANEADLGKTVGDDLREGKMTLPVIYAYEAANAEDKTFWEDIIEEDYEPSALDLKKATNIIHESGAYTRTIEDARRYSQKAKDSLSIFLESEIKQTLLDVVYYSVDRNF